MKETVEETVIVPQPQRPLHAQAQESASVLIAALAILLVLTIFGVIAMQTAMLEERMAGNLSDNELAFQAADAALREAEDWLLTNNRTTSPAPVFARNSTSGLHLPLDPGTNYLPLSEAVNWAAHARGYTGALQGVASQPRYIIERLPSVLRHAAASATECVRHPDPDRPLCVNPYRVTARGVGGTETAVVILQSIMIIDPNIYNNDNNDYNNDNNDDNNDNKDDNNDNKDDNNDNKDDNNDNKDDNNDNNDYNNDNNDDNDYNDDNDDNDDNDYNNNNITGRQSWRQLR